MFHGSYIMQCPKNEYAPEGDPVYQIVEDFADDHDIWAKDFLDAYQQMLSNAFEDLEDGPQNSWLGYASLQSGGCLRTFPLITSFIYFHRPC